MTEITTPEEQVRLFHCRLYAVMGAAAALALVADIDDPDDPAQWRRAVCGLASTVDKDLKGIFDDLIGPFSVTLRVR